MAPSVISCGAGVQSTALCVLAVAGRIGPVDAALFANTGDDSENPATLAYVRDHLEPWCAANGLPFHTVKLTRRDGTQPTLYDTVVGENRRGYLIPVRLSGGHPARRNCTHDWKLRPIWRWLRDNGATPADPATVAIGISVDEIERAGRGRDEPFERRRYPLLDLGLYRDGCAALIERAGLPEPPKSACWFCPFHDRPTWRRMRRDDPDLFARAARMEVDLNAKLHRLGRDPVWFTDGGRPLDQAIDTAQPELFGAGCDSGACFT